MIFVDTNVFTRLFAGDDERQRAQSKVLLQRAQTGEIELVTGPPVFFELAWVLGYTYKVKNSQILDILESILSFGGLKVSDHDLATEAIYAARTTNSSYADSYITVSLKPLRANEVATFNKKHFSRLGAVLYPLDG
jgi:predicted nucleic-acid-binding protein